MAKAYGEHPDQHIGRVDNPGLPCEAGHIAVGAFQGRMQPK